MVSALSGCYLLDGPATRSDDPGIVVSDYVFATSAEEREALIAPEFRDDWDPDVALPIEEGKALKSGIQEPAVRADVERDHALLASWADIYVITEDYEDGSTVRWIVAQRDPETDWYIIDIDVDSP